MKLLEHFKELTLHPKNAQELKGLILQLAVQGKLTQKWREENPDVEPASVLLKKISEEKSQLSAEGKLKREDVLPEIEQVDQIVDLPENWQSCRLGEVIEIVRGITFPSSEKSKTDEQGKIPCLRTANVQDKIEWDDLLYIDRSFVKRDDQILRKGDVIMSMANSRELVGKVAVIDFEPTRDFTLGGFISALRTFGFNHSYLMVLLRSPKTRNELISSSSQTTNIANVSISKLRPLVIPFPPLEEQKAIVEVVKQLFAEVEQLEALTKERIQLKTDFVTSALNQLTQAAEQDTASQWEFLQEHFGTFFTEKSTIKKLREAILQLAVQGKLTHHWRSIRIGQGQKHQDPYLLLKNRLSEQESHSNGKKPVKQKPKWAGPIEENEKHFSIPETWEWFRLGEVCELKHGYAFSSDFFTSDPAPFVLTTPGNFHENGGFRDRENKRKYYNGPVNPEFILRPGDLIIPMTEQAAGLLGSPAFIPDNGMVYLHNQRLGKMSFDSKIVLPEFSFLFFNSSFFRNELARTCTGMKVRHTSPDRVLSVPFPVCNLQEQLGIVEKVNGLMALCDQLEEEIETHQTTQEHWMQSCLREVLEPKEKELIG